MDYSSDVSLKVEKADFAEYDSNDNFQELYDVDIKVEKELESDDADWCVTSFENCGDLLEPLFFKEFTEPQGPRCSLCYSYFQDSYSILKHNLTHLQVTMVNPTLFQCDYCASYFTEKWLIKRHILTHYENVSKTSRLSYKPKAYKTSSETVAMDSNYGLKNFNPETKYNDSHATTDAYNIRAKPKDGMTYLLSYKPKTYKPVNLQNCSFKPKNMPSKMLRTDSKKKCCKKKDHQCNICLKTYTYKNWHSHMQTVHGKGGYFCGLCNAEFKCERYFMRHMTNIHEDTRTRRAKCAVKMDVKCDQCDTVLQSLNALKTHKRNVHSENHVCDVCDSVLKSKSYLLAHMRRVHYDDGKKHMCACGKSFKSPRYLNVHIKNAHSKKK